MLQPINPFLVLPIYGTSKEPTDPEHKEGFLYNSTKAKNIGARK
jgi:hypothetical protein